MRTAHMLRSDLTKEKLLDAAEAMIADVGFDAPSHRSLAARAGVHTALVNYHFGTKEMLFEDVLARRAPRLGKAFLDALASLRARPHPTVEDVLHAYWQPFALLDRGSEPTWRRYLCVFARLTGAPDGETWRQRYFGAVDDAFLAALRQSLPEASGDALAAGYRHCRLLLETALLHQCGSACDTRPGYRAQDIRGLIAFLGAGIRSLVGHGADVIAIGTGAHPFSIR